VFNVVTYVDVPPSVCDSALHMSISITETIREAQQDSLSEVLNRL